MRFHDTRTGATLEPSTEFVARTMAENPALVPLDQPVQETARDLSALTVAQLRELCDERGIDHPSRATKAQLIQLLDG